MPKKLLQAKKFEYQGDIATDGFGMPFAVSINRWQGIPSLTTGKGGVEKEKRNIGPK